MSWGTSSNTGHSTLSLTNTLTTMNIDTSRKVNSTNRHSIPKDSRNRTSILFQPLYMMSKRNKSSFNKDNCNRNHMVNTSKTDSLLPGNIKKQ